MRKPISERIREAKEQQSEATMNPERCPLPDCDGTPTPAQEYRDGERTLFYPQRCSLCGLDCKHWPVVAALQAERDRFRDEATLSAESLTVAEEEIKALKDRVNELETVQEPRGCPTPGACSCVGENAKLKDRVAELEASKGRDHYYTLLQENAKLKAWKESAMAVHPPMQEIAKELCIPLGESIHDKILPGIQKLEAELDHAQKLLEELEELWRGD